jgi:hypothetical protein
MSAKAYAQSQLRSSEEKDMTTSTRAKGRYPAVKSNSVYAPSIRAHDLSRERIAEDLATFRTSGGKIEVLGNTQFHTKASGASAGDNGRMPYPAVKEEAGTSKSQKPKW